MTLREPSEGIVVYSQPHCPSCRQVERFLDERSVIYEARDVLADPTALEEIVAQGFMATPVVRVGRDWIAGYRPDDLDRLLSNAG